MENAAPADDLLALTLELAGSLDARTVMRRILERSLTVAAADRATLSSFVGDRLVIAATVGSGGEVTWVGRGYGSESLGRQPLVRQLMATRRTVLGGPMTTEQALPEFRGALDQVKHTATVPVLEAGALTGMLVLSRYQDQAFTQADIPSLTGFGALAGLALRNAKLYEEATTATAQLQAAAEAAADVAALQDLPALLSRIIEHACEAAGSGLGRDHARGGNGGRHRGHVGGGARRVPLAAVDGDPRRHRGRAGGCGGDRAGDASRPTSNRTRRRTRTRWSLPCASPATCSASW